MQIKNVSLSLIFFYTSKSPSTRKIETQDLVATERQLTRALHEMPCDQKMQLVDNDIISDISSK